MLTAIPGYCTKNCLKWCHLSLKWCHSSHHLVLLLLGVVSLYCFMGWAPEHPHCLPQSPAPFSPFWCVLHYFPQESVVLTKPRRAYQHSFFFQHCFCADIGSLSNQQKLGTAGIVCIDFRGVIYFPCGSKAVSWLITLGSLTFRAPRAISNVITSFKLHTIRLVRISHWS